MNLEKVTKIKLILLLLIFIVLPFGYFARVNLGSIFLGIYYWDIFICLYVILSLNLEAKSFFLGKSKIPSFYLLIGLFILYASVVTLNAYRYLNSTADLALSSFYLARWSIYMFFSFLLYADLKNKIFNWTQIKNLIIYEGVLISIIGIIQLILLPDFTLLDKSLMWDPHQNRLAGLYFDPNFAGIILALSFCVTITDLLNIIEGKESKKLLPAKLFYACLVFIAIILTFSRSAWLAIAVIIFVMGILKYKWIIPLAFLAIFLVYYAVPRVQTRITGVTDPSDSFYFRFISWTETYEIAKTNPIIGYGFNTLRYIKQDMGFISYDEGAGDRSDAGSDSSLLYVFVTTGVVGLTIYLIAYIKLIFAALKDSKKNNFSLLFVAFVFGLLFNSQFINSMFFAALAVNFSIYTALFFAVKD